MPWQTRLFFFLSLYWEWTTLFFTLTMMKMAERSNKLRVHPGNKHCINATAIHKIVLETLQLGSWRVLHVEITRKVWMGKSRNIRN